MFIDLGFGKLYWVSAGNDSGHGGGQTMLSTLRCCSKYYDG